MSDKKTRKIDLKFVVCPEKALKNANPLVNIVPQQTEKLWDKYYESLVAEETARANRIYAAMTAQIQ